MLVYLVIISETVLSEKQLNQSGCWQTGLLVNAHHQQACLFKLDTHDAETSVCNQPISRLRVHARACTAREMYSRARKSKERRTAPRSSPSLLDRERLRVYGRRAKRKKSSLEKSEIFFRNTRGVE